MVVLGSKSKQSEGKRVFPYCVSEAGISFLWDTRRRIRLNPFMKWSLWISYYSCRKRRLFIIFHLFCSSSHITSKWNRCSLHLQANCCKRWRRWTILNVHYRNLAMLSIHVQFINPRVFKLSFMKQANVFGKGKGEEGGVSLKKTTKNKNRSNRKLSLALPFLL